MEAGWGATAALELARSWSSAGRRVILVDAALRAPSLHRAADVENREGLSDAALHGVSVARVSRSLDDGGLFLVTAGTPVADPREVVTSGRWQRLSAGMTEAGVLVLLYLREGEAETAAFLGSASDIVLLSAPGEPTPSAVSELVPLVRAVTGPEDGGSALAGRSGGGARPEEAPLSPPARSRAPSGLGEGGVGRVVFLILAALVAAAGLGYLLTSFL